MLNVIDESRTSAWPSASLASSRPSTSSTCSRTCSSCAACLATSAPTMARSSSPRPSRSGSRRSEPRPPISLQAAPGRMAMSRASMPGSGRAARRRDLLHSPRGADRHRELAPALQCRPAACGPRLQGTGPRGVRASSRRMAGSATPTSSAGHATRGAPTNPELTLSPDHSSGADQLHTDRKRPQSIPGLKRERRLMVFPETMKTPSPV